MIDKFLEVGFKNLGQIMTIHGQLHFEKIDTENNHSNVIWAVLTDKETLYIGETKNHIEGVIKDLLNGNANRATRNKTHELIIDQIVKNKIYLLIDKSDFNSKAELIKQFMPIGNSNGK